MKVTVMQIVIGAFETIPKILLKGLEGLEIRRQTEIIQTTAVLTSNRVLRRVLETWEGLLGLVKKTRKK